MKCLSCLLLVVERDKDSIMVECVLCEEVYILSEGGYESFFKSGQIATKIELHHRILWQEKDMKECEGYIQDKNVPSNLKDKFRKSNREGAIRIDKYRFALVRLNA